MMIDPDGLEALEAVVDGGSLAAAAQKLNKATSAVSYHLRRLEERVGAQILDRRGYRLALTPAGEAVLAEARPILQRLRHLSGYAARHRGGWEHGLRVVYDGALPPEVIVDAVRQLVLADAPTRIDLSVAHLGGVAHEFEVGQADVLIAAVLGDQPDLVLHDLASLGFTLCCGRDHALAGQSRVTLQQLQEQTELIIPGMAGEPVSPVRQFHSHRVFRLSDFHAKRAAIRSGLGFGWLPDYMADPLIAAGDVCRVDYPGGDRFMLAPVFACRSGVEPGRATRMLLDHLRQQEWKVT